MTILDLMSLVGLNAASWDPWRSLLAVLFGLVPEDPELIRRITNRSVLPTDGAAEAWIVAGRRAGKSIIMALVAIYAAVFRTYTLAPGEVGTVRIVTPDRRQARVILRYIVGLMGRVPSLAELISGETAESITLSNGIVIEIQTANFRSARGYTMVCVIIDEIAYLRDETSSNPDVELLNAIRPAMATIPNAMLLCVSSPYRRAGELWRAYKEHFGKDGDPVLVVQADSRTLNPSLPQSVVDRAYADDPEVAAAEYGALFRSDVGGYVDRAVVEELIDHGVHERPATSGHVAFVDASGGAANGDEYTIAIAHLEGEVMTLDCLRARRGPFNTEALTAEYAELLKSYKVSQVCGDRYSGSWVADAFRKHGILYHPSERTASEIYADFLPVLMSGRCRLLDEPKTIAQLCTLERRTARSGRDSISHAPGAHDDRANAVAGVLTMQAGGSALRVRALDVSGNSVRDQFTFAAIHQRMQRGNPYK
jgi:hypothetical protein